MPNLQTTRTPMTLIGCINLVVLGPSLCEWNISIIEVGRVENFVWIIEGSLNRRGYFFQCKTVGN